jgi:hypothetical protein
MKYLIFTTVFLLSFCSGLHEPDEFSISKAKWSGKNISDYEFTLRINCFCPHERVGPHMIKVVDEEIVSVNNQPYDPDKTGELLTIDQLFDFVETSIARDPYQKTIVYNSTYGYPETVFFDFEKQMADEELGYEVTDFKVN